MSTYYAISSIGWGKGSTPEQAEATYRSIQKRNYPGFTDYDIDSCWGWVWEAPEGVTGFHLDDRLYWDFENRTEEAVPGSEVAPLGDVPTWVIEAWEGVKAIKQEREESA